MLRNKILNCSVYINYLFKDKCIFLKTIQNSSRIILANFCRIRTFEIERFITQNFKYKFNEKKSKYVHCAGRILLGATILSFADDKISDEEIEEHMKEFSKTPQDCSSLSKTERQSVQGSIFTEKIETSHHSNFCRSSLKHSEFQKFSTDNLEGFIDNSWTQLINTKTVKLWRRPLPSNPKVYEYRLCGTFDDISARSFYEVQIDIEYRKQWDDLIVDLNIIKTDRETDTDTIRWITHYPYPMSDREYIFKRRSCILQSNRSAIIVSKAIKDETLSKGNSSSVRIVDYKSLMYIQSHNHFNKIGMDYFLIYYDDPKTNFPSAAVSWMSTAGIPSFIDKVHKASLLLEEKYKESEDFSIYQEKFNEKKSDEHNHYTLFNEAYAFNFVESNNGYSKSQ